MSRWLLAVALCGGCTKVASSGDDTDVADTNPSEDTDNTGGDTDRPDFIPCSDASSPLGWSEASALGFSAQDVLDAASATTSATGDYTVDEGGGSTTVTITLSARGAPSFHLREPIEDTDADTDQLEGPPIGAPDDGACPDWVEVPVTVRLVTADGKFDETVDAAMPVMELANLSVSADLDWEALGGTFVLQGIVPADWDTVSMDFGNQWGVAGLQGQVNVYASKDLGGGTGQGYTGPVLRWPQD